TLAYAGDLLSYGAKILIYENGFMHAKTIVVDGEVASVGTTNIDTRSFKLNFEVNAVIYDQNVANELQQLFLRDREHSTKLTMETHNKRSLLIRFKEGISRLLSPILEKTIDIKSFPSPLFVHDGNPQSNMIRPFNERS